MQAWITFTASWGVFSQDGGNEMMCSWCFTTTTMSVKMALYKLQTNPGEFPVLRRAIKCPV